MNADPSIKLKVITRREQSGFTLLELLIYIVIASLVMSSGVILFKNSASQRQTLSSSAEIRQASFLASHVLSQQFAQIGYRQIDRALVAGRVMPLAAKEAAFPAVANEWDAGQVVKSSPDSVTFRFQGASHADLTADNTVFDCHGNAVPAGTLLETTLRFTNGQLECTTVAGTSVLLGISDSINLEQAIFEFGVDDNNDGAVDRQVPNDPAPAIDFSNVRQVTAKFLLSSDDFVSVDKQPYRFNGQELTANDRRLRVESEVSVALRN